MADKKPAATTVCIRQCGGSCLSVAFQVLTALVFIGFCAYLTAVFLESLNIVGISTIPPGINYVPFRHADGQFYRHRLLRR
jgi:hypothetical protein